MGHEVEKVERLFQLASSGRLLEELERSLDQRSLRRVEDIREQSEELGRLFAEGAASPTPSSEISPVRRGAVIQTLREKNGLSRGDLAERSGLPETFIEDMESGLVDDVNLRVHRRLAEALDLLGSELMLVYQFAEGRN